MNQSLQQIFSRRSIRAYEQKPVPDSMVQDLLEAGMAAPSAVAKDPWRFVVVKSKETLARIAEALPNGKMLPNAAVGIVVCGDLMEAHDSQLSYLLQDCSAAAENILLAASMLGLGGCWLGIHPREERMLHARTVLGLPASVVPVCVLAVGWPWERKEPRTRYSQAKVHLERW